MKLRAARQCDVRLWRLAAALWAAWSLFGASASSGAPPVDQAEGTMAPAQKAAVFSPGLRAQERGAEPEQVPLRERLQKKIRVDLRKTPIEDVIRVIAEQADVDVVTSPNVKGETTVKLTNVALEEALRSILEVHGFDYIVGNNILKILPHNEMPPAPERLATQIFDITHADVNDVVKSLERFKSEAGSVSHIRGTSQILMTDKESKVKDIADFLSQVDRMTPQILVEARICDITSKDNFDLGVQWSAGTRTSFNTVGELIVFVTPWIVEQPALSETESQAYEETRFEGPRPTYTEAEATKD